MRRILEHKWFKWIIIVILLLIFIILLYSLGFRITYAPYLDNNWDAISGVASWVSALATIAIPIVAVFLQHKLDSNKREIAISNESMLNEVTTSIEIMKEDIEELRALYDEILDELDEIGKRNIQYERVQPNDRMSQYEMNYPKRALNYIGITMGATTKQVADYMQMPIDEVREILINLYKQGLIKTKYIREDITRDDCHWQIRR